MKYGNLFHLLPHDKYDVFVEYTANLAANGSVEFDEYLPSDLFPTLASNLEANSSADFDEFTTDELFEDAMQDAPLDDLRLGIGYPVNKDMARAKYEAEKQRD